MNAIHLPSSATPPPAALPGSAQPWPPPHPAAHGGGRDQIRGDPNEPEFVGRTAQLRGVEDLLRRDRAAGGPRVILIDGPAGIGKSRLLQEVNRRAAARGAVVLAGSATEFEQILPFGVFLDVLDTAGRAGVSLAAAIGDHRRLSGLGRFPFFRRIREAIDALAAPAGLLLVLDDVQWADEASLGLLEFLLHRPPDKLTAVIASYRTGMCPPGSPAPCTP